MFCLGQPTPVSGQPCNHGKQGNAIDVVLGGLEQQLSVVIVDAKVKAARSPCIERIIHDPATKFHGSVQKLLVAGAMKELRQPNSSPGHVANRRTQKEEWK